MTQTWRQRNMQMLGLTESDLIEHTRSRYMKDKKKARLRALPKFPNANRDEEITEVQQALASLYDEAVAAQKRQSAMGTPNIDGARFPSATTTRKGL